MFYNTYFKKGLTINNIHFTIHPTQLRDGTLVTYPFQKINFNNRSTSSSIDAQTANNTTIPLSSSQASADITNAATTPIPSSQANADITNAVTSHSLTQKDIASCRVKIYFFKNSPLTFDWDKITRSELT